MDAREPVTDEQEQDEGIVSFLPVLREDRGISLSFDMDEAAFNNIAKAFTGEGFEYAGELDSLVFKTELVGEMQVSIAKARGDRPDADDPDAWTVLEQPPGTKNRLKVKHKVRVNLWASPEGLVFIFAGRWTRLAIRETDEASNVTDDWQQFCDGLNARNRRLGFPSPFPEAEQAQEPPAPRSPKPKPLPSAILFGSDNVHGATVRAFAAVSAWPPNPIDGFAYGVTQDFQNLKITIGLPDGTQADSLWAFLSRGGAPMVKAHYALWGRWYEEGADPSGGELTVNVNQFCADLGYTPHHNGGFKRERKQEAVRILEALTAVELRATFTRPGTKPGTEKAVRLRGPLWRRGLIAEENDRYTDLFGQAREGEPGFWEPLAFSYAPGPWFTVAEWRKFNQAVGKMGAGLMRLDNRRDEWAVLIGGYLGTLARTGQYAPRRLRVATILDAANLAQSPDARRRASEMQTKFERALDRLTDAGVIRSWTWPGVDTAELCDPDDPDALAAYYAEDNPFPEGDWRARIVLIAFPHEADADRLQQQQSKAVAAARTRQRQRETKGAKPPEPS